MTKKLIDNQKNSKSLKNIKVNAVMVTVLILTLSAAIVGYGFLEYGRTFYKDKSAPGQFFEGTNISALKAAELQPQLQTVINLKLKDKVDFQFGSTSAQLSYLELGATVNYNRNFQKIKFYNGKPTHLELLKDQLKQKRYRVTLNLDSEQIEQSLVAVLPELSPPVSAYFDWNELGLEVIPENIGNNTNFDRIRVELLSGKTNLQIDKVIKYPEVLSQDIEPLKDDFQQLIATPIRLTYGTSNFTYNFAQSPSSIQFQKVQTNDQEQSLQALIDQAFFNQILEDDLFPLINQEPETLEIGYQNGKATFSGLGKSGKTVDSEKLLQDINLYLNSNLFATAESTSNPVFTVTSIESPPILIIDPELQRRGIKELVAYGYTTYHTSPSNRIHNIIVGTETYNGLIIPQGETFSFNQNLGPVNAASGYKPELVIKAEGTIPEYGGGICQVSSTVYRAALFAGLPITERYNHSYTVSYYAQVLGHGLDAAIYPGSKDLRFQNDTPADILIQSFTEGTTMTVRIFGTSDGRQVELVGPRVLSQTPAGAPIYEVRADLPPGTIRQVDKPVAGLVTEWTRIITSGSGQVNEEIITSRFRAVPPKYLVSPDYNNDST